MKNSDYWRNQAGLILPGEENVIVEVNPEQISSVIREFVQKGLTLLAAGILDRAGVFLRRAQKLIEKKENYLITSEDILYLYFIRLILNNQADPVISLKLTSGTLDEVFAKVSQYGQKDILGLLESIVGNEEIPGIGREREFYENESLEMYPYKNMAGHLVHLGRRYLITDTFFKVPVVSSAIRRLCNFAYGRILRTLAFEDPAWKDLAEHPARIKELQGQASEVYHKRRSQLANPMPRYILEADILELMAARILGMKDTMKKLAKKYKPQMQSGKMKPGSIWPRSEPGIIEKGFEVFVESVTDSDRNGMTPEQKRRKEMDDRFNEILKKMSGQDGQDEAIVQSIFDLAGGVIGQFKSRFTPDYYHVPYDLLLKFFDKEINPAGRKEQKFNLTGEIEWLLIARRYQVYRNNRLMNVPLYYFVREYLG